MGFTTAATEPMLEDVEGISRERIEELATVLIEKDFYTS